MSIRLRMFVACQRRTPNRNLDGWTGFLPVCARWDRLTGDTWGRPFEEWVERNVVVSRIGHWQSQSFGFQRQTYVGGLGRLDYRLLDASHAADTAHLNRLLQLASYTGIGYKTTHGLGQVRVDNG